MPENEINNPLDQLPPLQMPEAISFWPPAIGWWILAILVVVLCVVAVRYFLKRKRQNRLRKAALVDLQTIYRDYQQDRNSAKYLISVNRLLKQFVMQQYPAKQLHVLSGEQWLNGLAELSPQSNINADTASALLGIYGKHSEQDLDQVSALYPLLQQWFKGLRIAS